MVKGNTIAFIATSSCCMVIVYKQCVEVFTYCYIKYMFTFTKVSFFNVLCLYLKAPKINPDPKRAHDPQLRTTASQYTELTLTPYQQHTHTDTHTPNRYTQRNRLTMQSSEEPRLHRLSASVLARARSPDQPRTPRAKAHNRRARRALTVRNGCARCNVHSRK